MTELITTEEKIAYLKANRATIIDFMYDDIQNYFTWVKPTKSEINVHIGKFMQLIVEKWDGRSLRAMYVASDVFSKNLSLFSNLCDTCFSKQANAGADMQYEANERNDRRNAQMLRSL